MNIKWKWDMNKSHGVQIL